MRSVGRRIEVLLAVAGLALLGGLLVFVLWPGDEPSAAGAHGAQAAEVHGDGLSDSHDGFRLVLEQTPAKRGSDVPLAFQILNESGKPQTEYLVNQTKLLHLLVVRDDMHAFQHVHPELDGDTWRSTISVPDGGLYRIFAEFVPKTADGNGHGVLLGAPFIIAGDTTFVPLPEATDKVRVDGYTVTRPDGPTQPAIEKPATLGFKITGSDGEPAELDGYLGSYAHISAFNAMTSAATHLHPMEKVGTPLRDGTLTVRATFEQRGEHRVFVEFKAGGKVHVAAFTVFAT